MKRETLVWTILMIVGGLALIAQGVIGPGLGRTYVERTDETVVHVDVPPPIGADESETSSPAWIPQSEADELGLSPIAGSEPYTFVDESTIPPREYWAATQANPADPTVMLSVPRTIGLWIAAFFTLSIFSFLYKDNPFYKLAESTVVGVSAAYWMVVAFWDVVIPNLVAKLEPSAVTWAMPGTPPDRNLFYLFPLLLGIMLLWRLSPKGAWIARWPLAFIIGTTAGFRLIAFLHGDFLAQIRNSIVPFAVFDPNSGFAFWPSLNNVLLVLSILACLVYFFFSIEHKGAVGGVARVGIWVLMITFGAAFGYTVMGRIALLAIRLEFLMDNWLWLIDPTNQRVMGG